MRRRIVDTRDTAREIREKFQAKKVQKEIKIPLTWPKEVTLIGRARAEMYHSDKWNKVDDYKHLAEAEQDCFICPGTKIYDENGDLIDFDGEIFDMDGLLPKHFAVLAPSLGLQVTTHGGESFHVDMPDAIWGAARNPETGEAFFLLYSRKGIHFILTGEELDVEVDGMVG